MPAFKALSIVYNSLMPNETRIQKKKVAVGLSGGVDSSVAAKLLIDQGYEVHGVHMMCWDYKADGCRGEEDRADAVKVATKLGIPFTALNFEKEYREKVIGNFYDEYRAGRTPNPDVLCNKEIKFGLFLDWALTNGFQYIATGHYVKVLQDEDGFYLVKGADDTKDQSYFLYLLGQDQLKHTLFPIGDLKKTEVRTLALKYGFHTADKPDSVGICFIGDVDIKEFLKKELPINIGNVVNASGEIIGNHDGVSFYTIGQRHGFRITKYQGLPLYVIGKDITTNELIVGFSTEGEVKRLEVLALHWVNGEKSALENGFKIKVRIRHLGELYPALYKELLKGETCNIIFDYPVYGVAPGQSAVFYVDDVVQGGGVIGQTYNYE